MAWHREVFKLVVAREAMTGLDCAPIAESPVILTGGNMSLLRIGIDEISDLSTLTRLQANRELYLEGYPVSHILLAPPSRNSSVLI